MLKPEDLYNSPNRLADYYSHFKVSERLLLTGHSHQAWPDCGYDGQKKAWLDAAEFVDDKWEKAFAKADIIKKGYLKLLDDDNGNISLSSNTHDLIIRFLSALPLDRGRNIVTTDGEFHTIRRQLDRLAEEGLEIKKVASSPIDDITENLIASVDNNTVAVLVSKVFFNSGEILDYLSPLMQKCDEYGIRLLIDAYHALNVAPFSIKNEKLENAFIIGGGYKYCQLGEGNCFLRFPPDTTLRPVITGWYSEYSALSSAKKRDEVIYGNGDDLFAGATYDPTSHYRGAEVFNFFNEQKLTPEFLRKVSQHQIALMISEFDNRDFDQRVITRHNNLSVDRIGGFLVLYTPYASEISGRLKKEGVWTDYRADRLRLGPAPYLSDEQIINSMNILNFVIKNLNLP